MQSEIKKDSASLQTRGLKPFRGGVAVALAASVILGVFSVSAQVRTDPKDPDHPYPPWLPSNAIRLPDKNDQMRMREQEQKSNNFEAVNAERRRQMIAESDILLQLAKELKTQMDKTNKDTLSLDVIKKADLIERLAHDVKEKMKLEIRTD